MDVHRPREAHGARGIDVKDELETIEELLRQIEEARKNARVALIDMEALGEYVEQGQLDELDALRQQVQDLVEQMAAQQGLERTKRGYQLTPQAMRLFQGKLLEQIFSALDPSRTGRHQVNVTGDGAVEMVPTRPYEFGDSVAHMDIPGSLVNAMLRQAADPSTVGRPLRLDARDIEVHRTRNTPKCATSVVLDMSGSMRYGGLYVNVKKMALALQGLVQREFPGDYLQFIEMFSFAKPRPLGEIATLLPKPVTIFDAVVRLRADMADPAISETDIPPHFTNIQHALQLSRQHLARQDTPNKQVILITDGLPTRTSRKNNSTCSTRLIRGPKRRRSARPGPVVARGSRSTSFCSRAGHSRGKTSSLPIAWPRRPGAASSSRRARISTGSWCGTT